MVVDRFWAKVDRRSDAECWPWLASLTRGYGRFHLAARHSEAAHRVAYRLLVGEIPAGLTLDHLCRNRGCVNPAHLEPVTNRENVLRGVGPSARAARATRCPQGHPYTPENTRHSGSSRRCRTCESVKRHVRLLAHPDAVRESRARWRAANLERCRRYDVDYYRRRKAEIADALRAVPA